MDVDSFSPAHGCAVEKPGRTSRTFWAACPESAARGGLFSWLLLFWPSKREVTRPPQEDETLCTTQHQQSIATEVAPTRAGKKAATGHGQGHWAPAFAGVTGTMQSREDSTLTPGPSQRERERSAMKVLVTKEEQNAAHQYRSIGSTSNDQRTRRADGSAVNVDCQERNMPCSVWRLAASSSSWPRWRPARSGIGAGMGPAICN